MMLALEEAKKAYELDEPPVGCVIVKHGEVIATGFNERNRRKNVLAHAEIIAINKACEVVGDWRLEDCIM